MSTNENSIKFKEKYYFRNSGILFVSSVLCVVIFGPGFLDALYGRLYADLLIFFVPLVVIYPLIYLFGYTITEIRTEGIRKKALFNIKYYEVMFETMKSYCVVEYSDLRQFRYEWIKQYGLEKRRKIFTMTGYGPGVLIELTDDTYCLIETKKPKEFTKSFPDYLIKKDPVKMV